LERGAREGMAHMAHSRKASAEAGRRAGGGDPRAGVWGVPAMRQNSGYIQFRVLLAKSLKTFPSKAHLQDVLPRLPFHDLLYGRRPNPVFIGEHRWPAPLSVPHPDRSHLVLSQLAERLVDTLARTPFSHHVGAVSLKGSKEQVRRITAQRNVAGVADE